MESNLQMGNSYNLNVHMEDFSHLPVIRCKWWNLDWIPNPTLLHSSRAGGPWGQSSPYLHVKQTFSKYPWVQVTPLIFMINWVFIMHSYVWGDWLREVKFLAQDHTAAKWQSQTQSQGQPPSTVLLPPVASSAQFMLTAGTPKAL